MKFSQSSADLYAPGGKDPLAGLSSTTHLGIGAHADDLEILAFPGIATCFQHPKIVFLESWSPMVLELHAPVRSPKPQMPT